MAEIDKIEVTEPVVRLNTQNDPSKLKEGEYTYSLNAIHYHREGHHALIGNNEGNYLQAVLPIGYMILGHKRLDRNDTVILSVNPGSRRSEIGLYQNGSYTTLVNDPQFNFSINHQIDIEYKTTFRGERVIYWTDFFNPPRWLNLDDPAYRKVLAPNGCDLISTGEIDIDFTKIFKNYFMPCTVIEDIVEGGALTSATYFIVQQYADANSNGLTAWSQLIGPIPIFRDSLSESFEFIAGIESNKPTGKAIKISISNPDLSFKYINIGVVRVINGVRAAFRVATLPISATEFVYTGAGNTDMELSLDEVLAPPIVYSRAKTIESTGAELLLGNLKGMKQFNWQPYISKLQVQWQIRREASNDKENSFKNPLFTTYYKTFRQDEVYALGMVLDLIDGTSTHGIHIPGRKINQKSDGTPFTNVIDQFGLPINPADWDTTNTYSGDDVLETGNVPRWKIYNTATIEGTSALTPDALGLAEYGEMAYWQSERTYPCEKSIWGSDAGEPIRHHKFFDSSVLHIHDGLNGNRSVDGNVNLHYVGIRLPNIQAVLNSFPPEIRSQIKGWRIVVGDRTYNKSVIASGIMFNARKSNWKYDDPDPDDFRLYPNYPLNDLRPDPYIMGEKRRPFIIGQPFMNTHHKDYLKDTFFFHSPDTHFKQSFLNATEIKINAELYGKVTATHDYVKPYPEFKEKNNDNDRAAVQPLAIAWYNNYKPVPVGNTRRKLKDVLYVPFNAKVSSGNIGTPIWNVFRESSVVLGTTRNINDPTVTDTSRFIVNDTDTPPAGQGFGCNFNIRTRDASLYYVTLKNNNPSQYGDIFDIRYNDTCKCRPTDFPDNVVFAGDTFVGPMSFKTQQVFYQSVQEFMHAGNGLDGVNFRPSETIAHTRYYYKNTGGNPRNNSDMMCEDNQGTGIFGLFGDGNATGLGFLALMFFGIPNFWVESDINIALRYSGQQSFETFYPHLGDGNFKYQDWLSIQNIDKDNVYYHNDDYSIENDISYIAKLNPSYDPDKDQVDDFNTRCIYSLKSEPEDIFDNWQIFKPLNKWDFPKNRGSLQDIRYLGNYKTIFRMEKGLFIDQLYTKMAQTENQIVLGSGNLFEKQPEEILYAENGFAGTQSQWAFNSTEFGSFFVGTDKVFQLSTGLQQISREGNEDWFEKNLPFKLNRQIRGIPTDNPANPEGLGILSYFDYNTKTWYLTKHDYELVNPADANKFSYRDGHIFFNSNLVSVKNKKLFINRSWTMAYNALDRGWIGEQSFHPHYSFNTDDEGLIVTENNNELWAHGDTNNMHTYFGVKYPFIIEGLSKQDGLSSFVNPTLSFISNSYQGGRPARGATFNKAIVYNFYQCSGLLNLILQDENNLFEMFRILGRNGNSRDIALRIRDARYNFSDFFDIVNDMFRVQPFFNNDWNNPEYQAQFPIDKVLDNSSLDYSRQWQEQALMRERWLKYRLILDNRHDIKLLLSFVLSANRVSAT